MSWDCGHDAEILYDTFGYAYCTDCQEETFKMYDEIDRIRKSSAEIKPATIVNHHSSS